LILQNTTKPGEFSGKPILISTTGENISIFVTAAGEIAEWLDFEREFTVSSKKPYQLNVLLRIPEDLDLTRRYTGTLRFTTGQIGLIGKIGSFIRIGVEVDLIARIISCEIDINTVLKGKNTVLEINLFNTGNTKFNPRIVVSVWDSKIESLIEETRIQGEDVQPSTREEFFVDLGELKEEEYWAEVKIEECDFSDLIKLDIKEASQEVSRERADEELEVKGLALEDTLTILVYAFIVALVIFFIYRVVKDRREKGREREEYGE